MCFSPKRVENAAQLMTCAVAAALVGVALFPSAADAAGPLDIVKAIYGNESTGKTCDGTSFVARACSGRQRCYFMSDDHICGDPSPEQSKTLRITYKCAEAGPFDAIFAKDEKNRQMLACF